MLVTVTERLSPTKQGPNSKLQRSETGLPDKQLPEFFSLSLSLELREGAR